MDAQRHVLFRGKFYKTVEQLRANAVRSVRAEGRDERGVPGLLCLSAIGNVLSGDFDLRRYLVRQQADEFSKRDDGRAVVGDATGRPVSGDDVADEGRTARRSLSNPGFDVLSLRAGSVATMSQQPTDPVRERQRRRDRCIEAAEFEVRVSVHQTGNNCHVAQVDRF